MRTGSTRSDVADIAGLIENGYGYLPINGSDSVLSPGIFTRQSNGNVLWLLSNGRQASWAGNGQRALTLFEAAYTQSHAIGEHQAAASALFLAARQARINSEPTDSLRFASRILELADSPQLKLKGYLALAHHLIHAGRDADVLKILRETEPLFAVSNISDLCEFLELHACASAMQGNAIRAMGLFDILLDYSSRNSSITRQIGRLALAACNTVTQGQIAHAKSLYQRSVKLAQQYELGSLIPMSILNYAWGCLYSGDIEEARTLFERAEIWPCNHSYARLFRSSVGLTLGILIRDYDLIERCMDLGALELAFKSKAPQEIGPIAAAIYQCYVLRGRSAKAAELLSRSLLAIDYPDDCWWLLLLAATSGTRTDVTRGLTVLAGYSDDFVLAHAHRLLLHSRAAGLDGCPDICANKANEAVEIFAKLGWRYHQATALELAERYAESRHVFERMGIQRSLKKIAYRKSSGILSVLELEIVHLVIDGLTDRQVAARLGMGERTVRYHLRYAFDKLNCQNRTDLAKLFSRSVLARMKFTDNAH